MSLPSDFSKIHTAEQIIGYQFKDHFILWEALQAAGSGVNGAGGRLIPDGNKRLAVFGGVVLQMVVAGMWYSSGAARGTYSMNLQTVGSNANLRKICAQSGLEECINANVSQQGMISPAVMTSTMEAIFGAAFKDGGLQAAKRVMEKLGLFS